MNIDCIAQFISIVKDILLTLTAAFGAWVAYNGLSTWRRQLKGGVEYDLARRILKCTYRLREAIKGVRNPAMWKPEMPIPPGEEALKMSKEQIHHYGVENAYQKRWDRVTEVWVDLQTEILEAEVIWGRTIHDKFKPVIQLQRELYSVVRAHLVVINPNEPAETRAAYEKINRKKRDILYDGLTDSPDDYTQDIASAIEAIEGFLKPYLRK